MPTEAQAAILALVDSLPTGSLSWSKLTLARDDPLSGHLFLFLNRRRDRVKILFSERDGLVIWYKRLEAGTFQQLDPAARADHVSGPAGLELTATDLALLLNGIDLATARRRKRYSRSGV
jgi:transposase